jgi:hypothetical protein
MPTEDTYMIEFEDHSDFDWSDMVVMVVPQDDGRLQCTAIAKYAGFVFGLRGPDGNWVYEQPNFKPRVVFYADGGDASYGMHKLVRYLTDDADRILMCEYEQLVVDVVPYSAVNPTSGQLEHYDADLQGWLRNGVPAARHFGAMNVLFNDLSVRTRTPTAINPLDPDIRNAVWRPNKIERTQ